MMRRPSPAVVWLCVLSAHACEFASSEADGESVVVDRGVRAADEPDRGQDADVEDADAGARDGSASRSESGTGADEPVTDAGPYPSGPYGFGVGDTVLDAELTDEEGAPVRLSDLRARAGVKVILWSSGAEWCGVCRIQAAKLQRLHTNRANEGLLVVESLHQSIDGSPANAATLGRWRADVGASYLLLAEKDPNYANHTSNPLELVIDARTMKIRYRQLHVTSDLDTQVDAALAQAGP